MNKNEYLNALLELKEFLKEHPEQNKIYSDIHIQQTILQVKYDMIEEELHVQNRLYSDGFENTDFNPFL